MILLVSIAAAMPVCPLGTDPAPDCTAGLQAALDAAEPGQVLELREGTFAESVVVDRDVTLRAVEGDLVLVSGVLGPTFAVHGANLTLQGLNATSSGARVVRVTGQGSLVADDVFLRGDDQLVVRGGVVWIEDGDLSLTAGIVSGGSALAEGGLISVGGDARLVDVDLDAGRSEGDGGLIHVAGTLVGSGGTWRGGVALGDGGGAWAHTAELTNVRLVGNQSGGDGGGGFAGGATLVDVELIDNAAGYGGGFSAGALEADGLVVTNNTAAFVGGGIEVRGVFGDVRRSVLCDNRALVGGAIGGAYVGVRHSLITRNRGSESAGGVYAPIELTLSFVHLVANDAPDAAAFEALSARVVNSIIAENQAGVGGAVFALDAVPDREQPNLLWDNSGTLDDRLPVVVGDPMLQPWEDCTSLMLPSYFGAARDAATWVEHADPDGSIADLGAFGQGELEPELWYDFDDDGFINLYDCAPTDPTIFPGAYDAPYDGVHQDCRDNDDFDADGDGHRPVEWGGDDCDDNNPERAPDHTEIVGNAVDEDCDGWAGVTAEVAPQGCEHPTGFTGVRWWRR